MARGFKRTSFVQHLESARRRFAKRGHRRVDGDVAVPIPHRPGRADFPHPVPHERDSLAAACPWAILADGRGWRFGISLRRVHLTTPWRSRRDNHFRHIRTTDGRTIAIVECCRRRRSRRSGPASSRTGVGAGRGWTRAGVADTSRSPRPPRGQSGPPFSTARRASKSIPRRCQSGSRHMCEVASRRRKSGCIRGSDHPRRSPARYSGCARRRHWPSTRTLRLQGKSVLADEGCMRSREPSDMFRRPELRTT